MPLPPPLRLRFLLLLSLLSLLSVLFIFALHHSPPSLARPGSEDEGLAIGDSDDAFLVKEWREEEETKLNVPTRKEEVLDSFCGCRNIGTCDAVSVEEI